MAGSGFPSPKTPDLPSVPWQRKTALFPHVGSFWAGKHWRPGQGEKGAQLIHPAHPSLAGKHWLLPRGQHSLQGLTGPAANSGHCHPPARKPPATHVVTLLPDHQASPRVCLKGIFPRHKILRPLFLGCLAEQCCHVFMAIAACRRWDPEQRRLWGCYRSVAQVGWGFISQHLTGQCVLSSACSCPIESTALRSPLLASAATHPSHQWLGFGGICLQMGTRLENGLAGIR